MPPDGPAPGPGRAGPSAFRVALVFPDLLGTYGDSGNAVILAQRLRWRDRPAEVVEIHAGGTVPDSCDLYVVGGGEDQPQSLAARELNRQRSLHRAVERGAAVLAVCAGLQILGTTFVGPDSQEQEGLGLLDCATVRGRGPRAVGELVVEPASSALPVMTGYENHGGVTTLGAGAEPFGYVRSGVGNGATPRAPGGGPASGVGSASGGGPASGGGRVAPGRPTDGVVCGRVWGTYMHGPVLARNPALADAILSLVTGPLPPLDDAEAEILREERLRAAPAEASAGSHGSGVRQAGDRHPSRWDPRRVVVRNRR